MLYSLPRSPALCRRRNSPIAEAQALLATLADTDEVKNAAAARERRLKLQTTLGQAMMHAHGFGSPETMAVFARARELTSGIEDPPARLAACYGQWVGAYMRGNAALMRTTASSALAEAEASSDPR